MMHPALKAASSAAATAAADLLPLGVDEVDEVQQGEAFSKPIPTVFKKGEDGEIPLKPETRSRKSFLLSQPGMLLARGWSITEPVTKVLTSSRIGKIAKKLVELRSFDRVVVTLIIFNCILMASEDPLATEEVWWKALLDNAFTAVFAVEMCLKLLAYGLEYFRDPWNNLDALVVTEGIISAFAAGGSGSSIKTLRVLRVLRPLRTVKRFPRLQLVVSSLLQSGWTLGKIILIFFFYLLIFSVMGVVLWKSTLRWRCVSGGGGSDGSGVVTARVCGVPSFGGQSAACQSLALLDQPYECPSDVGEVCVDIGEGPFNGNLSFDNTMWSLLTLFTVVTLEGWGEVMMYTQRVSSENTFLFFVALIVIGAFTVANLAIAAMLLKFKTLTIAKNLKRMREKQEKERLRALTPQRSVLSAQGSKLAILSVNRSGVMSSTMKSKIIGGCNRLGATACGQCLRRGVLRGSARRFFLRDTSPWAYLIYLCIFVNLIVLALDGYGISSQLQYALATTNLALTIIFAAEMIVLWLCVGPISYFSEVPNVIDSVVVVASILELFFSAQVTGIKALRMVRLFRLFRIMRVGRLAKTLVALIGVIIKSARDMVPVVMLMALMIFIFSILGMQLFGTTVTPTNPNYNGFQTDKIRFDSFFWSFTQVFYIITGDNWNVIMYDTMDQAGVWSGVFFIALVLLGQFVLLNLVLAIVLEGASDQMKENYISVTFKQMMKTNLRRQYMRLAFAKLRRFAACDADRAELGAEQDEGGQSDLPRQMYNIFMYEAEESYQLPWWTKLDAVFGRRMSAALWEARVYVSPYRSFASKITSHRVFDLSMFGIVLLSTFLIAFPSDDPWSVVNILDSLCMLFFLLEMALKIAAQSFWRGPQAYMRNSWNYLDLSIILFSIIGVLALHAGLGKLRLWARVLKSMRPLRILHRMPALQVLLAAILNSVKACGMLLSMIALISFGYSIIGMNLFSGVFSSCTDPDFQAKWYRYGSEQADGTWTYPPCSGSWVNPETGEEELRDFSWASPTYSFDNIGISMLSTFIISTLDGWMGICWNGMNSYGMNYEPSTNYTVAAFFFFFVGIVLFGFYITNLFVGVLFESFLSFRNTKDAAGHLMTQDERRWIDYKSRLSQVKPLRVSGGVSEGSWRAPFLHLSNSPHFGNFIVCVLAVNAIALALDHAGSSKEFYQVLEASNLVFTGIFVLEAACRIIGLGLSYFQSYQYIFDFTVTVASCTDIIVDALTVCGGGDTALLRLLRSLRVWRILRLASFMPGFHQILIACVYPLSTLANVGFMMFISIFIFASIGVALFGEEVDLTNDINMYAGFRTLPSAMQLLFIVATGEGWADYANAAAQQSSVPLFVVMLYFIIFTVAMCFILTNLFIMVIVETFEILNADSRQNLEGSLSSFQQTWARFDPKATGYIVREELLDFILALRPPLGEAGEHGSMDGAQAKFDFLTGEPEFSCGFTEVLLGLGQVLLTCEMGHENHLMGFAAGKPEDEARMEALRRAACRTSAIHMGFASCRLQADSELLGPPGKAEGREMIHASLVAALRRIEEEEVEYDESEATGPERPSMSSLKRRISLYLKRPSSLPAATSSHQDPGQISTESRPKALCNIILRKNIAPPATPLHPLAASSCKGPTAQPLLGPSGGGDGGLQSSRHLKNTMPLSATTAAIHGAVQGQPPLNTAEMQKQQRASHRRTSTAPELMCWNGNGELEEWSCACGTENLSFRLQCTQCGRNQRDTPLRPHMLPGATTSDNSTPADNLRRRNSLRVMGRTKYVDEYHAN